MPPPSLHGHLTIDQPEQRVGQEHNTATHRPVKITREGLIDVQY
jgi:hypothetical protein